MIDQVICGFCVTMFFFVCFVCRLKIFIPSVSFLQSLTLGTRVLFCGLFKHGDGIDGIDLVQITTAHLGLIPYLCHPYYLVFMCEGFLQCCHGCFGW